VHSVTTQLRVGSLKDVDTFARLMNDYHQSLRGENLWDVDELRATLLSPTSDPVSNDRYIDVDGSSVAAIHTHVNVPYDQGRLYLALPILPRRVDHARMLLEAAIRLMRSRPEMQQDATVEVAIPTEDQDLLTVTESLGFIPIQRVYTLESDVRASPLPVWPAGITVSTLNVDEQSSLDASFEVLDEAFPLGAGGRRMEYDDYAHMVRRDPTAEPGLSVIVEDVAGPVGVSINFRDTTRTDTGHVVMLGVVSRMRNRGIGSALLHESFRRFREHGWTHARASTFTGRSSADLRLFEAVGMQPLFHSEVLMRPLFWDAV